MGLNKDDLYIIPMWELNYDMEDYKRHLEFLKREITWKN